MKKLVNLFKFLSEEMAYVWFTNKNGEQRVGDIVVVKKIHSFSDLTSGAQIIPLMCLQGKERMISK